MLVGFLHHGGIGQWSYAVGSDIVAQGNSFMRFTSEDVNFKNRTIEAEIWKDGIWVKKVVFFPIAIKNFELNKGKDKILDSIPYSLGQVVQKNDQMDMFFHMPSITKYIPKSYNVEDGFSIIDTIKLWGAGLLKPSRGRLGQGIIFIKVKGSKFDINIDGDIKNVNEEELIEFLKPFYTADARDYILQQFAAGTGPNDRYFNIRVIVTKSGDGDWHACNFLISLLAQPKSIIANRDVGSNNIDLHSWLKHRYKEKLDDIYNEFFSAAVNITRVLDDATNQTAEEIALDMAIDNSGQIWLHEANWRGGMWLFEDDIGLYRHSGANLQRISLQSRAGNDLDRANAMNIAIEAREDLEQYASKPKNSSIDEGVLFGIELNRRSDETSSLVVEAITQGLAVLSISSATSFRAAQKRARYGIEAIKEQVPRAITPFIISKGGACVYDSRSEKSYQEWMQEELLKSKYIDNKDLESGFSISNYFLKRTIKENCKDLNISSIDLFIIEGLEYSLANRKDWESRWKSAINEMHESLNSGIIQGWTFSLKASSLNQNNYLNPKYLLSLIDEDLTLPNYLHIKIDKEFNFNDIEKLFKELKKLKLRLIFSLPAQEVKKKEWNELYSDVQSNFIKSMKKSLFKASIILCPVTTREDLKQTFNLISSSDVSLNLEGNKWLYNRKKLPKYLGDSFMKNKIELTTAEKSKIKSRMEALSLLAKFDYRQYFRFFVDGRFHKKYRGWIGYEENEQGSVPGILKAYSYMLDNFDISGGLTSSYIKNIHALCMKNVITQNPKSTPGDLRYLEAGINISYQTTIESLQELLDWHKNDNTPIFHTRGYEKSAKHFTAESLFEILKEKKKLKFRPWYPVLTKEQKSALNDKGNLESFYEVKHFIQSSFAKKTDEIVYKYNQDIKKADTENDILLAIAGVARGFEILHPFPDGNGRTFVATIMNHLLLYNGLLPAILYDPNMNIDFSFQQWADEMKKGIEDTKQLLETPEVIMYDFSVTEFSDNEVEEFKMIAKDFITRISPYIDIDFNSDDISPYSYKTKYLYLTPERLSEVTKGVWINTDATKISKLRFEYITVDEEIKNNQLFFFRKTSEYKSNNEDIFEYIKRLAKNGVTAIVSDNLDVARESSLPALYVKDVDDALADAGRAARNEVNCKSIAVIGSIGKTTTKFNLQNILNNQAQVHTMNLKGSKTPHIMTSLANLRLTDNIEINEIAIDKRPNPAKFRVRAVNPDIILIPKLTFQKTDLKDIVGAYAATADGIKEGGLYIINSDCEYLDDLIDAITEVKNVSIQTYGTLENDIAKVVYASLNKKGNVWSVQADILGESINYTLKGSEAYLPSSSVGILLTLVNLGYDINQAAKEFN